MVCLKVDENLFFVPVLREDASRGAHGAVVCLSLSQAGSSTLGVALTFRDTLARLSKRRDPAATPTPGGGRTSFSAQKQRELGRRRQPGSAHTKLRPAHWLGLW